ncbi:MAG: hypothetical protein K1Y02_05805 [Candidatus Hydrogenedentes bacterium]|nr:hypothetical protein [Candidatus Hydrogenedentota bacterium]
MEPSGREGIAEHSDLHIDADAVCEQCSTVNPPGTLLCKMCGNNLRDQRTRRLSSEGPVIPIEEKIHPRRVLSSLLMVLGLLVVLWVAFNVSSIESMLTQGFEDTGSESDPELLWTSSSAIYEELAKKLVEHPVSPSETEIALSQYQLTNGFDGRYVLKRSEEPFAPVIGQAIVETQGDSVYFVATVGGNYEFRGEAKLSSPTQLDAEYVGVKTGEEYIDAYGMAQVSPGQLYCGGYAVGSDTLIEAIAYHVPEMPDGSPVITEPAVQ